MSTSLVRIGSCNKGNQLDVNAIVEYDQLVFGQAIGMCSAREDGERISKP
jgi:hypothetical protein